ncbi:unsaturated glucuronyl hydrolase [Paenibacillus curdlanolyticus YK9]|uniref:Unsaturated glucuronyl hydrolase n=1 Tax=Paenibacillus curdlanolyticus YK9 TaxID=717606 RepID=E0ICT0_9BACL|nr:hypothetical protein [Paenibacillus curdlanolyticus]EFM09966.1 unsaturated glucuronyl hydrolase [Paenibacillus curdlanolyticus YK9]
MKDPLYLESAKRQARYFFDRLSADDVVYRDFDAPINEETKRDSSASAIAACVALELLSLLPEGDKDRIELEQNVQRTMTGLVRS